MSAREPDAAPRVFATGYLCTQVKEAPGNETGYVWSRAPGARRPQPFTPVTPTLREALSGLPDSGIVLTLGKDGPDGRRYHTGSPYSAGHLLAGSPDAATWTDLAALLHHTGQTLRALHTIAPDTPTFGQPPGTARLTRWLDDGDGPGAATRLHTLATIRLGANRLRKARAWCEHPGPPNSADTLLHGGPTVGALVPGHPPAAPRSVRAALLTGEELARGPAEYDLGWLLGELAEFRLLPLPGRAERSATGRDAVHALLAGYGQNGFDAVAAGRVATLRVLTHAHDFAAYVTWTDELGRHMDLVAHLLDTNGRDALCIDTPPAIRLTPSRLEST